MKQISRLIERIAYDLSVIDRRIDTGKNGGTGNSLRNAGLH